MPLDLEDSLSVLCPDRKTTATGRLSLDAEVWRLVRYLSKASHRVHVDPEKREARLEECGRSLSSRTHYDAAFLRLSFDNRMATLWTAKESGHNGDSFDEKEEDLDWDKSLDAARQFLRPLALVQMQKDIERQKEEAARAQANRALDALLEGDSLV